MEFLHLQCGTWHWYHDIEFTRWQHPAMWHVALRPWQWIHQVAVGLPCNVTRSCGMTCHWIRQVAAPCNMACSSGIMTVNSPSGSTLQCDTWLWDDMPLNSPGGSTQQCGMCHCGYRIMTVNSLSGSTLQCDTWLWDDTPLNSPGDSTLQRDR